MRIGDTYRPELGLIDYAGYAQDQARMQMATSSMLAKALETVGTQIGERREMQSEVKASSKLLREAMEMNPTVLGELGSMADYLDGKEGSLGDKVAISKTIAPLLELGISKYEADRDAGFRDRGLKVQEGQLAQSIKNYELDAATFNHKVEAEQQSKRGEALGRFAALMESTAPYADRLPDMSGTRQFFMDALQRGDYAGALATVDSMEKALGKPMDAAMKPVELKPHKLGGEINGRPYELDLLVDPQGNFYDLNRQPLNRSAWGDGSGGQSLPNPQAFAPELESGGVISAATEQQIKQAARGYLSNPNVDMDKVPLGMRNNNPTNIVFPGMEYAQRVGAIGASRNKDAGSSKPGGGSYNQLVFGDPVTGMRAGAQLAARKYGSGATTAAQLIAGQNGWTPGNTEAAANVARTMGLGPNDDLRLNDPARMKSFLKALVKQEHGEAGSLYKDEVYNRALGMGGNPTITDAMQAYGVIPKQKPALTLPAGVDFSAYMSDATGPATGSRPSAANIDPNLLAQAMKDLGITGQPAGPKIGQRPMVSPKQTPEEVQQIRRAESADKRVEAQQQEAATLANTLPSLKQTAELLEKGVKTGFGAETLTAAKRMFGQDVTNEEQLQTLMGDFVMQRVSQTKGAVSEREMDLFQQYSANFGKTTEGNKRIVQFAIKAAERAKKIERTIQEGFRTGKSGYEIEAAVAAIRDAEPLGGMLEQAPPPPPPRGIPMDEDAENGFFNTKPSR